MSKIEASAILAVTRELIGDVEPCGDSAIDRKHAQNLDKLICVVDALLNDVIEVKQVSEGRAEGSIREMGEKAKKELIGWHDFIEEYFDLKGDENE